MLIKYICTYFFLCVPFRALYNQRIGNYSQKTEDGSRLRPRRQPANCVAYLWGPRRDVKSVAKRAEKRLEKFVENAKF